MTITRPDTNGRGPSSREINQAIEVLRSVRADEQALRLLDIWNARRLVYAASGVDSNEELRNLFTGLKPNSKHMAGDL